MLSKQLIVAVLFVLMLAAGGVQEPQSLIEPAPVG